MARRPLRNAPAVGPARAQASRNLRRLFISKTGMTPGTVSGDDDMSNQIDGIFEQQDTATKLALIEMSGDELTEIAVEALCRAFQLLREDFQTDTVH